MLGVLSKSFDRKTALRHETGRGKTGDTPVLTAFLTTLQQMLRIVILLTIGFAFNRSGLITRAAEQVLSKLVTLLFLPCLTLYTYMVNCDFAALITYSRWALIGGACMAVSIGCALPLARLFGGRDAYLRGVYRYAFAFPNTGGVLTPMILALFGTAGLFKSSMFLFINGILCYTWGIMQLQPAEGRHTLGFYLRRIFNANFIAMLIGIVLGLAGAKNWMPEMALGLIDELGGCYVTIALLLTGFSIADYPIRSVVSDRRVYAYSLLRLLVLPGVFLVLMKLMDAPPMLALVAVLTFGCPCGMNTVVFPAAYGEDCRPGASMVLVSSVLSIFTVSILYALVTAVFGAPV